MPASAKKVASAYLRGQRRVTAGADEALIKWLAKRAKKGKGVVQMNMVEKAFDHMDGWSIVPTTTYLMVNGNDTLQQVFIKNDLMKKTGAIHLARALTTKDPIGLIFDTRSEGEAAIKTIERMLDTKTSPKAKTPNGKAVPLKLYASKPVGPRARQWGRGNYVVEVPRMWVGVSGWLITAANNKSIALPQPLNHRGKPVDPNRLEKFNKFWTWSYKNGLAESAKQALEDLDDEAVEMATAPKAQRERLQQQRIMLPVVKKLLVDLTQKQYQGFVDSLTNQHVAAVQAFMEAQEAAGEKFDGYSWFDKNKMFEYYKPFIYKATEKKGHYAPYTLRNNYMDIARGQAKRIADEVRESFVGKNGMKLSLIVKGKGNLKDAKVLKRNSGGDFGGEILFTFKDGSSFVVRNKTVFKISPLGRPFEQYPTTFHKVKLPNGKALRSPSEKRMVEVFAVA